MGGFKDLRDFTAGAFIELPIDGRLYRINDVDGPTGILVQRLMDLGVAIEQGRRADTEGILDDDEELDLFTQVLGVAYEDMVDDGVDWSDIKHAATTAMIWIAVDEETAIAFWESGGASPGGAGAPATGPGSPPAGPNRATRRASAGAARSTRSRASGSTTTGSRPARKAPAKPAKSTSRGRGSSSSGT